MYYMVQFILLYHKSSLSSQRYRLTQMVNSIKIQIVCKSYHEERDIINSSIKPHLVFNNHFESLFPDQFHLM